MTMETTMRKPQENMMIKRKETTMSKKTTELAVMQNAAALMPEEEEIKMIFEDLDDLIGPKLLSVASIAGGGAGVFKIREAGTDEAVGGTGDITGVIIASHPVNVRWATEYGKNADGDAPACKSVDGRTGISAEGEVLQCAACKYNEYNPNTGRKDCSNKRQLYILREGDVLPLLLSVAPSGLKAFDNYRIFTRLTLRKQLAEVVTRISLKNVKSRSGITYSAPVFEAVSALPAEQAKKLQAYGQSIMERVQSARLTTDEMSGEAQPAAAAPAAPAGFVEVSEDDLPFD